MTATVPFKPTDFWIQWMNDGTADLSCPFIAPEWETCRWSVDADGLPLAELIEKAETHMREVKHERRK